MQLSVNPSQRHAKMRAHTATHLLHALIHHYIPTTQQAGSLVDNDYVRFDYTSDDMLTPAQITEINVRINEIIGLARDVTTTEMNIDQALATGAKAFFQDKYGDIVRVVQVLGDDTLTSVELCGGTHISNTREIGAFVIVEQSPVASGTKRIVAYTGPKTLEYSLSLESNLQSIASKLDCSPKQIDERLSKMLKEYQETNSKLEGLMSVVINQVVTGNLPKMGNHKVLKIANQPTLGNVKIGDIVDVAKTNGTAVIIISDDSSYAIVSPQSSGGNSKEFAQSNSLKGGGNEILFQGKDPKIFELTAHI